MTSDYADLRKRLAAELDSAAMNGTGSWTVGPLRAPVEMLPNTEQEAEK